MKMTPAVNPSPSKIVTGTQIKAARALLGWRRIDLAAAAGLHRNAIAYWERRQCMPRSEPFACRKMRAALLAAGVIMVTTPAPGVCLLRAGSRRTVEATAGPALLPPDLEKGTLNSISAGQELAVRSSSLGCAPGSVSRGDDA